MEYYITVGKRLTRIAAGSMQNASDISQKLVAKYGEEVVLGTPQLITPAFDESRSENECNRAHKILDLIF